MGKLDDAGLDLIFRNARTAQGFLDKPIEPGLLQKVYELAELGPTGSNSVPMRVVFVTSREAKEKLKPAMAPGNADKTMAAPATAIVAYDTAFYEKMDRLFPMRDVRPGFRANPEMAAKQGLSGAWLQAGYLMVAARSLGLDCGPMGGFDNAKVDAAFLEGTGWKSVVLVNLGYIDPAKVMPRLPRLSFEEACKVV